MGFYFTKIYISHKTIPVLTGVAVSENSYTVRGNQEIGPKKQKPQTTLQGMESLIGEGEVEFKRNHTFFQILLKFQLSVFL